MAYRLITPPAAEPWTLAEVKTRLRVDHNEDDADITTMIKAARQHAERWMARAIITQTWELVIDEFPDNEIMIRYPPLQSVTSVKYDDTAGVEQTLASTEYTVDNVSQPGWIVPVTTGWPSTFEGINAVRIRFVAGYDPDTSVSPTDLAGNVPFDIKAAIMLDIAHMYANRESVLVGVSGMELPLGSQRLMLQHQVRLSMA